MKVTVNMGSYDIFSNLSVGDVFKVYESSRHSDEIYLKTECGYVEWSPTCVDEYIHKPYNSFGLTTNKRYNFSPDTHVVPVDCELLVK